MAPSVSSLAHSIINVLVSSGNVEIILVDVYNTSDIGTLLMRSDTSQSWCFSSFVVYAAQVVSNESRRVLFMVLRVSSRDLCQ